MNNYWYTDAPAQQGGYFTLRYALTSGSSLSQADATQFAMEQRSELLALRQEHKAWKQTLPVTGFGFLRAWPAGTILGSADLSLDADHATALAFLADGRLLVGTARGLVLVYR